MTNLEREQRPWVEALQARLGDVVSTASEDLEDHGRDEGYQREFPPECVVYPRNKQDILDTLKVA